MKIGRERVTRARLSDDARRLENVEVIGEGIGERRIVVLSTTRVERRAGTVDRV